MKWLLRLLRRFLIWLGPALVLLLAVILGFAAWVVASEPGTRWALGTAVHYAKGSVGGIEGSLWHGLKIGNLSIDVPNASIRIHDLELEVEWRELLDRRLHARTLSAGLLDIDILRPDQEPEDDAPFSLPALPVRVALDRFYVGELGMKIDGEPLLLNVQNLETSLAITENQAQLLFRSLHLGHDQIDADIEGELRLEALEAPWPLKVHLQTQAHSSTPDSPLCLRHFLPDLPTVAAVAGSTEAEPSDHPLTEISELSAACALDVDVLMHGTLDDLDVAVKGDGQDVDFSANAKLAPQAGFIVRQADLDVRLADGSSLTGNLNWSLLEEGAGVYDHVVGSLQADRLNLRLAAGDALPPGAVTAGVDFDARLRDHRDLIAARIDVTIDPASRWNQHEASGTLHVQIDNTLAATHSTAPGAVSSHASVGADAYVLADSPAAAPPLWQGLRLSRLDTDIRIGNAHLKTQGSLGVSDSKLQIDVSAARLADLWPDTPGGVALAAQLEGSLAKHRVELKGNVVPDVEAPKDQAGLGKAPIDMHIALAGGWEDEPGIQPGVWSGAVSTLQATHAALGLDLQRPVSLTVTPQAIQPAWQWQVGETALAVKLSARESTVIRHDGSRGGQGRWQTQGRIEKMVVSAQTIGDLKALVASVEGRPADRGRVTIANETANADVEIVFAADWKLAFDRALSGDVNVKRLSGDFIVPAEPSFPLGLETMDVHIAARPADQGSSRVTAELTVATKEMGRATAKASTLLHASPEGGFDVRDSDVKTVEVHADIGNLAWLSLFVGDAMDIGGSLHADVSARSRPDGTWATSGTVTGEQIRVVRVDDGVRLLDGELRGHFENDQFILDRLYFPARLRVTPQEWRTAEWVSENPDAKDGGLTLTGSWSLYESTGLINIDLYRYPLLQRSDRYAMVTGKLAVDAPGEKFAISGNIMVDAGWVDMDMLASVPSLDSDVVVIRAGETVGQASAPVDIELDIIVDLGPRFYITGYGVNSGLVGQMRIMMSGGRLTAEGALRTRGGAIEIYGQRLQLRRGTITFQGDITNPVLNIEALRTGLAVEAGVRVAGTAKRPRIDLVSYPDVSDVQKLSWLLLGRGPDDSGGDAALLFSVGTSFLAGGEPFYRKFGIDELSLRSGELGSTGSLLPVESVVRDLDSGTSDIERRFLVASKNIAAGFTLSLEQALSDTGTVGRISYRLARGLSAELSVGTVNGIALIYRTIFTD